MKSIATGRWSSPGAVVVALVVALCCGSTSLADGPTMSGKVTGVSVRFQPANHPQLPSAETISAMTVELMREGENLYAAADAPAGAKPASMAISQLHGFQMSKAAVDQVQQRVIKFINRTGVGAVACRFDTPATGSSGAAVVNVVAGTVADVRSRATGDADANTPTAARVVAESPIQGAAAAPAAAPAAAATPAKDDEKAATEPATEETPKQLLNTKDVDEYLARLNRFPGRSVAATISAGDDPATLVLDYLVAEEKTFNVFAEVSNFGTPSTSEWLERFGAYITQLSNNDDILSIDVLTGNFQNTTFSVNGYYDARIGTSKEFRWRVTGNYSDYTASDIGDLAMDFTGSSWGAQGDVIWNFYQEGSLFVDLDVGFRYWGAETQNVVFNSVVLSDGDSNFMTPTVSLNLFDMSAKSSVQATLGFDYTSASADQTQLDELGREETSENWCTVFGSASWSTYLDADAKLPVHELTARGSGQWAFNYRLTPLAMSTLGGYYTVRGYPQSAIAGDSSVVGTLEYRLHIPRAFNAAPPGRGPDDKPFRWAPDAQTGAGPDWDLALVGFIDAGAVWQNQALSYEENATLIGAGAGVECSVRQNLKIVAEYGWALKDLQADNVTAGNGQFYFLARLTF